MGNTGKGHSGALRRPGTAKSVTSTAETTHQDTAELTKLRARLEALRRSEQQLARSRHEWVAAFDAVALPIFIHDESFRIVRANRAYAERAGSAIKDVLGKPYWEVFPRRDGPLPGCVRATEPRAGREAVDEFALASGEMFRSRAFQVCDEAGRYAYSVHILEDITAAHRAQARLEILHRVIEALSVEVDFEKLGCRAIEAALELCGADFGAIALFDRASGMLKYRWHAGVPSGTALATLMRDFRPGEGAGGNAFQSGRPIIVGDYRHFTRALPEYVAVGVKSALSVPVRAGEETVGALSIGSLARTGAFDESHVPLVESVARQVGAALRRRQLTEEVSASAARFRRVVEAVPDILFALDLPGLRPSFVSPAVTELLGFTPEEVVSNPALWRRHLHKADRRRVFTELARAVQSGEGLQLEVRCWHKDGRTLRYFDGRGTVVRDADGRATGVLGVLTDITRSRQLEQERRRLEAAQRRSARRLEAALVQTIQAVALTIEKRDPYTAGHQQRVAALAVAIGRALGLDDSRVQGIRFGGIIHDIGKIYVPAEILNRPGRLTPAEFELIKSHPLVGYDIIKGVELPWPVAEMVLQHHERLDGSGYPAGLQGEAIALEARILAVADVIEAMVSHRPYRPGRSMEEALAEISRGRGVLYDAQAVDACVRLIRDQGWRFEEPV